MQPRRFEPRSPTSVARSPLAAPLLAALWALALAPGLPACGVREDAPAGVEGVTRATHPLKLALPQLHAPSPPLQVAPVTPPTPTPTPTQYFVAPGVTPTQHAPGRSSRRVAGLVGPDCTCPAPLAGRGWERWELFPGADVRNFYGERFCAYRFTEDGPPDVSWLPTLPGECGRTKAERQGEALLFSHQANGQAWLSQDDEALYGASVPSDAAGAIATAIRQQHRAATGGLERLPTGGKLYASLPQKTKWYLLDDTSDVQPGAHGESVTSWMRETICPGGDCQVWVHRRNVLSGDGAGSVLELARAVFDAAQDAAGWPAVLNLSLQLHPARVYRPGRGPVNDDVPSHQFRVAYDALRSALNYAACRGVAVVAAAGNRDPGSEPFAGHANMYGGNIAFPAAYGQAWQPWSCDGGGGSLAYAAGAVAYDGSPSASTRPRGEARLNAPSAALTAEGAPIAGTSFSTAAISGAAALVAGYAPFQTTHQVMGILYDTADAVPGGRRTPADGYGEVRRLNLCAAIERALSLTCAAARAEPGKALYRFACDMERDLRCNAGPSGAHAVVSAEATPAVSAAANAQALTRQFEGTEDAACAGSVRADADYPNARYACPAEQLPSGAEDGDVAEGSPGWGGCAGCMTYLDPDGSLWFMGTIVEAYVTSPSVTLQLTDAPPPGVIPLLLPTAAGESEGGGYALTFELGELASVPPDADSQAIRLDESFAIKLADGLSPGQLAAADFTCSVSEDPVDERARIVELPVVVAPAP